MMKHGLAGVVIKHVAAWHCKTTVH